ncbi:heterokaryon incompatibility protein-domain-containing protein [Immersiella caudata]|uniref:Heterokaryon incompatibility protein-domain-containing protein n=1 Tax=Immersiella caudata TaxID=314043 RepID=A0AA39WB11_9PEZI|nr:heterokaryon incompatibility protein-domain-containing protein [Immersiella caudata]
MTTAIPIYHDAFTYGPPLPSHSIRLLRLHPGTATLRCTLTTHTLSSLPPYEALSYAWGNPRKCHLITCNNSRLHITKSLFHALCQLRRNGQSLPLWIDAICINQSSNLEKSVQVRMMRQIYERAEHVRVWLGVAVPGDEAGLALLRKVYERCRRSRPDELDKDFSVLEALGLPGLEDPAWKGLAGILYRPYFYRIWIVQEVLAARAVTFLLGEWTVEGEVVLQFAGACERYRSVYDVVGVSSKVIVERRIKGLESGGGERVSQAMVKSMAVAPSVKILWFLRFTLAEAGWLSVLELLNNTRGFHATDPRDKIFAVVGLAGDMNRDFVETFVDYDKSLDEVQTELAAWFLTKYRRRDSLLFSYVEATGHSDSLPSWVPDWTGEGMFQGSLAATWYSYEEHMLMANPVVNRRIIPGGRIKLEAVLLDQIAETVDKIPYMTSSIFLTDPLTMAKHMQEMEGWEDSCWDLAQRSAPRDPYAPTGERLFEAYWRALIFDTDSEHRGRRAAPELKDAYEHWASSFGTSREIAAIMEKPQGEDTQQQLIGLNMRLVLQSRVGMPFETAFQTYIAGRKFCATKKGYIGWVPLAARPGDFVCYLEGNLLPFIIRRFEMHGYRMVGDCYFHGLMRGPVEQGVNLRSKKIVLF